VQFRSAPTDFHKLFTPFKLLTTQSLYITTMPEDVQVKDFKVALVGGGICGLTCAIALARVGVSVEVFEAAVSPSPDIEAPESPSHSP